MKTIKDRYKELLQLTQLFLLQEAGPSRQGTSIEKKSRQSEKVVRTTVEPPLQETTTKPQKEIPAQAPPPPVSTSPPAPKQEIPHKTENVADKETFVLDPPKAPEPLEFRELKVLCSSLFPHLILKDTILDDSLAKKKKNAWQTPSEKAPVILLSFNENNEQLTLLKNIAHAIENHYCRAEVVPIDEFLKEASVEKLRSSKEIRLILACDTELYLREKLMKLYRHSEKKGEHFLGETPLLLLSDLSLYLKEPKLKAILWRAIGNQLKNVPPTSP